MTKKVCFIINTLSGGGGAERTVQNLSNKYASEGMNVTIILLDEMIVGYKLDESITVKVLNSSNYSNGIIIYYKKIKELGRIITEENFDYVFSFLFRSNLINIITSKSFDFSPIVISERSFSIENYKGKSIKKLITKWILKISYSKADAIIAISEGVKNSLISDFTLNEDKIKVIYNPIASIRDSIQIQDEKISKSTDLNLITIGRLVDSKNQSDLIKVIKILRSRGINAKLKILGEGPLKPKLEKEILDAELENFVELLGYKENVNQYLEKSDLFIFASKYEAFGNVILEAMQVGLPVISYPTKGGPSEIIGENTYGILLKDNSVEEMVEEIIRIMKDTNLYQSYSALSQERANYFSLDQICLQYLNVFDNANK